MTFRTNSRIYSMWTDGTVSYTEQGVDMPEGVKLVWKWVPEFAKVAVMVQAKANAFSEVKWDDMDNAFTKGYLRYIHELAAAL